MRQFLTQKQTAEILQVHRSTLHRWLRAGRLESVKIGGTVRIPASALERIVGPLNGPENAA